jgi:hypothetical protein
MASPPVARPDLRPLRAQIEALLTSRVMISAVRLALVDAFEEHGTFGFYQA